ncbi:hypothetical protein C8R43DRAFT_964560 [Mycena crocata]|nr:hypothetical protein C8R43DRAFT_964560 [Mycena crocata]
MEAANGSYRVLDAEDVVPALPSAVVPWSIELGWARPYAHYCQVFLTDQDVYRVLDVRSVLGRKISSTGVLVAPTGWVGEAAIAEYLGEGMRGHVRIRCRLTSGRHIRVDLPGSPVHRLKWNVSWRLTLSQQQWELLGSSFLRTSIMGRQNFSSMLEEERVAYREYQRPSSHSPTQPFRAFVRSLAREEYEARRSLRYERFEALRASTADGIVRRWSGDTMTADGGSPFAVVTVSSDSGDEDYHSFSPSVVSDVGVVDVIEQVRTAHFDYQHRLLVDVVTADYVQLESGVVIFRHAVVDPSVNGGLRRGQLALVVGMVHRVVRLTKNHGSTENRPFCRVLECVAEDLAAPSMVLLAANTVVHPSFTVEMNPDMLLLGQCADVQVVQLDYLDRLHGSVAVDASIFRVAMVDPVSSIE